LDAKTFEEAVNDDLKLGTEVNVEGTPTLFLNGKRVEDISNIEALRELVDDALSSDKEASSK